MLLKYLAATFIAVAIWSCADNTGPVASMEELKERVDKLKGLTTQMDQKRNAVYNTIREFNKERPENEQFDIASMDTLLGADEQDLLRTMFKNEQDVSLKGLLGTIIEKNKEITGLSEEVNELQNKLPRPYLVSYGDTHYEIVMDYLTITKRLTKKEAENVALKTAMVDDILPGNQVWLMYHEGNVGTYVTQGSASISPLKFQIQSRRALIQKSKMISNPADSLTN